MQSLSATAFLTFALPLLLGAGTPMAASASPEQPSEQQVNTTFSEHWQASLCNPKTTARPPQPYINFSFHGPITEYFGSLCYHFAGYNETCLPAQKRWLTPATSIELIAPGQVPIELLRGYTLLVRFPWQSDELYRYPLFETNCHARSLNH